MHIEVDQDRANADFILDKIIEAVKRGESDSDRICSRVLLELSAARLKPDRTPEKYP
jgi:hypothetical protein